MMDLIKRTLVELDREVTTIATYLQRWWGGMSDSEQLYFVGIVCAALLLLGLRRPDGRRLKSYHDGNSMGMAQQFLFAAAILVVFTFGIDIAFDSANYGFR